MTNVTVQEALNNDVELIRAVLEGFQNCYPRSDGLAACRRIKAALSEIEKCEPVAYIHKHYLSDDKDALDWHKREHPQFKMIPLCRCDTSPQPRDWVELSELDIADAYYKAMNQELRPSDKVGVYKVANAIEAKCKQLNTKG